MALCIRAFSHRLSFRTIFRSVRACSLGHLCQGLYPSPLDRIRAARLAAFAVAEIMREVVKKETPSCATVGFHLGKIVKTDVEALAKVRYLTVSCMAAFALLLHCREGNPPGERLCLCVLPSALC